MEVFDKLLGPGMGELAPLFLLAFLGAALIIGTIPFFLKPQKDPLDKLKETVRNQQSQQGQALRTASGNKKLEKYSTFLEPQDEEEYSNVQMKLMQAGYRSKDAVLVYHFSQMALGLGLLAAGLAYYFLAVKTDTSTAKDAALWILGPGCAGYMLPKYWVNKRTGERQTQIAEGFPDALDMMLVCVEAGQSLDQAIVRVSKEIRASFPALADEFEIVSHQVKAGKDKSTVLNDMSERCGVMDVSSFVTVMIQSQAFGTSIAEALRVYAGEMRDKRVMRAEEKANKLPTKMTLATMALTLPPLMIILVSPSVIGIMEFGK